MTTTNKKRDIPGLSLFYSAALHESAITLP